MRKFNAIKNAVNFGKSQKRRDAETRDLIEYLDRQKEKRMSNEIQVNDKVKWIAFKGMEDVVMKGVVESIGEFNDVKTFTIRKFPELGFSKGTQTMVTASRVTKI